MTHNHEVLEGGRKKVEVVEVHGLFARMCAITLFLPVPHPFDCPTPWLNWSVFECLLIERLLIVGQAQGKASQARSSNCPRGIMSMCQCLACSV